MMAGYQFVKDGRPREGRIVTAHAHHFLFVRHGVGRIRNQNCLATEEERADQLAFRGQHLHEPRFAADGIADDVARIARPGWRRSRALETAGTTLAATGLTSTTALASASRPLPAL